MKHSLFLAILMSGHVLNAQNVLISEQRGSCEPSIKIDPSDPLKIVAGIVLDQVAYSKDGGRSWKVDQLHSDYGVWGDPVIDADGEGRFYYFHLSNPKEGHWIDRIVCQRSDDGGKQWNNGSFAGLNAEKQQDKHWSVIDQKTGAIFITWTEFDTYGSTDSTCYSKIRFSASYDHAASWTEAITISEKFGDCIDDDGTTEGAVPALGPDGEIYVCWANEDGLVFSKSLDEGKNWSKEKVIDPMPGGWAMDIPGIYRANGMPILKVDLSNSPSRGTLYVNWADQRNGLDDTDIWLKKSIDGGETWTDAQRVNNDPAGRQQFFTWMDIDQSNGKLYFVFYDRRAHADMNTDVYLAYADAGSSEILNLRISERPFIPDPKVFFGDYTNISAVNGVIRPIWTRMDEGKTSVWTDLTEQRVNPGMLELLIPFELEKKSKVCLLMQLPDGKIKRLFTKKFNEGPQQVVYLWDSAASERGNYIFLLKKKKEVLWRTEKTW